MKWIIEGSINHIVVIDTGWVVYKNFLDKSPLKPWLNKNALLKNYKRPIASMPVMEADSLIESTG